MNPQTTCAQPRQQSLRPIGLAGLAWGGLLLWRGRGMFEWLEGRSPSQGEEALVQALGLRHMAEGALQVLVPRHLAQLWTVVDVLHAASMAAMARAWPERRSATAVSCLLAAAGAAVTIRA